MPYVFSLVGYIPFRSGQTGTKKAVLNSSSLTVKGCEKASREKIAQKKLRVEKLRDQNIFSMKFVYLVKLYRLQFVQHVWFFTITSAITYDYERNTFYC